MYLQIDNNNLITLLCYLTNKELPIDGSLSRR